MIISVASGKGGTGKTTLAVNLALSLEREVLFLDCDVEEPNSQIFLKPKIEKSRPVSILIPQAQLEKCDFCGKCAEICEFKAIAVVKNKVLVFPELCHACGGCSLVCPKDAIEEVEHRIGVIHQGKAGQIEFIEGKLDIGQARAVPLITEIKKYIDKNEAVIIDSPPGTSCPVVESIRKSDFCILVTEPTPFGLSDLVIAIEVVKKLGVPFGVVINQADIGNLEVKDYCKKEEIPILLEIPFDRKIAQGYSKGKTILDILPQYREKFKDLYSNIKRILAEGDK